MSSAAMELLRGLVLEDGRHWGEAATDWQVADAEAILEIEGPRRHFITRPRGGSKTTDLGGVGVAALLTQLGHGDRAYGVAGDRDQGALLVDAIRGFVERTDGLSEALQVDAFKVTARETGATLEILAADEATSWGLKPELVIVDELSVWKETPGPRRLWRSLFSALPKRPRSRLVVITMAGDPAHFSYEILERARKSSKRWHVSETPGPCPWISDEDLDEQKDELPEWEFERLHMNVWRASADKLTTVDDLRACVTLDGPQPPKPGRVYGIGVDIGLKHDRTVVAVTSMGNDGRVALDRMAVWQGTRAEPVQLDDVEAWILTAWGDYGRPDVLLDPYQAAQLSQRLQARRVRTIEYAFTQTSVSKLALRMHNVIRDHAIDLPADEELIDELAHVRLSETSPGVYRMDHDPSRHDDRAIALALGVWLLLEMPVGLDEIVFADELFGLDEEDDVAISLY